MMHAARADELYTFLAARRCSYLRKAYKYLGAQQAKLQGGERCLLPLVSKGQLTEQRSPLCRNLKLQKIW